MAVASVVMIAVRAGRVVGRSLSGDVGDFGLACPIFGEGRWPRDPEDPRERKCVIWRPRVICAEERRSAEMSRRRRSTALIAQRLHAMSEILCSDGESVLTAERAIVGEPSGGDVTLFLVLHIRWRACGECKRCDRRKQAQASRCDGARTVVLAWVHTVAHVR